jgi:anti-anti-sigma factor
MLNPSASVPPPTSPVVGSPPLFLCTRRAESSSSIRLVLAGELDLANRAHFQQALSDAQADASRVILDLPALTFIDCASLSVIFNAAVEARRAEGLLILLDPRGQVRRVLKMIGAPEGVAVMEGSDLGPVLGARSEMDEGLENNHRGPVVTRTSGLTPLA